ncbi:protease stability complex PrcB-like protein [Melghirimyces profundicolus]|uniref:Protease stability complex PrcB-like protein n=1 Tax=Melghirimyces profundicolus TaxID=1242148 RepID=A0A2T6BCX6_9BACL|nr:protease complex subunit PrcB family protein [Melghirimyces profundicolus]PTX53904.1 protease stability complex PrcB-like protein [Melghirimyces profundicolus]
MEGDHKGERFLYRVLSVKEQKKLPKSLKTWLESIRAERGVHQYRHRGVLYLVIAAGMKPNPGHSLELTRVKKEGGTVELSIREKVPGAGRMHPQVISYPCLVIRVKGAVPRVVHAGTGKAFAKGGGSA